MDLNVLSVIWSPTRTLQEVAQSRNVLAGAIVTLIYAILGIVVSVIIVLGGMMDEQFRQPGINLPPGTLENFVLAIEIGIILSAAFSPFLWWVAVSLLMQLTTSFFGGSGPLKAMFAVVGVAMAPLAISSFFGILLNATQAALGFETAAAGGVQLLSTVLGLGFGIWHVALVVIGAAKARGVGYGQSSGSCAISCAGCATLIIVVGMILGIVVGAVVGASMPQ